MPRTVAVALWLVLLAVTPARADIPLPPQPLYGAAGPRTLRGVEGEPWRRIETALFVNPTPRPVEPDPDIRTVEREVTVDVYLGIAHVRDRTVLGSDRPVRGLRVGFVQDRGQQSGLRLRRLRVTVDGREVEVESRTPADQLPADSPSLLAGLARRTARTWEWTLDVDGRATMVTEYVVPLALRTGEEPGDAELRGVVGYDLELAQAWRGGIGPTTLRFESHGPLVLREPQQEGEGRRSVTLSPSGEAQRVFRLVGPPEGGLRPGYCRAAAPAYPARWIGWVDLLVRAGACGGLDPWAASALVDELLAAARGPASDDQEVADELLESIAAQVAAARAPSRADEPEWLDDAEPDPTWEAARRRALESMGRWGANAEAPPPPRRPTKRTQPPEAPPPRDASTLTGLRRFVGRHHLGTPNAVIVSRGADPPRPLWALGLLAALIAPFAIGWARWRRRRA